MNIRNLTITLLCFLMFACSDSNLNKSAVDSVELDFSLVNGKKEMPLSALYNDSWSELILVPPYTNVVKLGNDVGVDLNDLDQYDMDVRDDVKLLVFIKNRRLAAISEIRLAEMNIEFFGEKLKLKGMNQYIVKTENERGYRTYEIR